MSVTKDVTVTDLDRKLAVGVLDRWDEYEGTVEEMMAELSAQARQEGRREGREEGLREAQSAVSHLEESQDYLRFAPHIQHGIQMAKAEVSALLDQPAPEGGSDA